MISIPRGRKIRSVAATLIAAATAWPAALPAWGQAVTLAELQGAVLDVSAVHQEKMIRNGQTLYPRIHTTGQVTVGPGDTVTQSFQNTAVFPDGRTRAGPQRSGTFTLGKPKTTAVGDDALWLFSNGSLVRLRVHGRGGAGGHKMTIAFRRTPGGLTCAFSMPMARETGVGEIRKDAEIDGSRIQILEFKRISSSCRVAKR
jgi:hypothetical protein